VGARRPADRRGPARTASPWGSTAIRPTPGSLARTPRSTPRGRPRSTCAGRSTAFAGPSRRCRRPNAPTAAWREADAIATEDVEINRTIGEHGLKLLERIASRGAGPINVMTHCNAGALATCGWGTATAPIFLAHARGMPVHVWVSETRPAAAGREPDRMGARAARRAAHDHR
jgi:hypothetical protein